MGRSLICLATSLSLAVCLGAGPASAQPAAPTCWSAPVERQQQQPCSGMTTGALPVDAARAASRPRPTARTAAPAPAAGTGSTPVGEPKGGDAPPRGDLPFITTRKAVALLMTEISGLERLFAITDRKAPDRPRIARRAADAFPELAAAAFRDKVMAETDKRAADARRAAGVVALARRQAVKYYTLLAKEYPTLRDVDEVLYYLAYELEQSGDRAGARKAYYELIQKAPGSRYVPSAYLSFGDLFFSEALSDPSKWALAEQAYNESLRFPAPANRMWGYAQYKLAYVFWNQDDLPRALAHMKQAIEFGLQNPTLPNAEPLSRAARRDLVTIYAHTGRATSAPAFFRPLAGTERDAELLMLGQLGQAYLDIGQYAEAIATYEDLLRRDRPERKCVHQAHVADATLALAPADKSRIVTVLDAQVAALTSQRASHAAPAVLRECRNATASLLVETATAWHLEAVGTGGVPGTRDPKTVAAADRLYALALSTFSEADFASLEFPRIVKDDWPSRCRLQYYRADLLYSQGAWDKCGPAFDAVVAGACPASDRAGAAYASAVCYQKIYDRARARGDRPATRNAASLTPATPPQDEASRLAARPLTEAQRAMIASFDRYRCYVNPAPGDKAGLDQLVEVEFARARTLFEAQHFDEAAAAFRAIALSHADHDAGADAADLYLESVNALVRRGGPERGACLDKMAEDVPVLDTSYCGAGGASSREAQCTRLTRVRCDVQRAKAQDLVSQADQGVPAARRLYEQAAGLYMDLWRKYGEAQARRGAPARCDRMDEIVYNTCRAFQAARLMGKAIQCRQMFVDPATQLDKSPLASKAVYELGGNLQAIADYDKAASWYERFARAWPKASNADTALSDAVVLRLGLGQVAQALDDADLFRKTFGAKSPRHYAQIAFAIGAHDVEQQAWGAARTQLSGSLAAIDRSGDYDVRVQAHAMLGRALAHVGQDQAAAREYAAALALWRDPKAAVQAIERDDDHPDGRLRRTGRALGAVGEAYFFFAEQKRKATVERIPFPEYRSPSRPAASMTAEERRREADAVKRHVDTRIKDWVERKRAAIEAADREYQKILQLEPTPPPSWVIASGAAVGTMWSGFVDDFRRAPIPRFIADDDELRGIYVGRLDAASEPVKQRAKAAYMGCLDLSVRHQYFDSYSRACEAWLSQHYRNEFHMLDEFRGAPTLVGSGLEDRLPPLPLQSLAATSP